MKKEPFHKCIELQEKEEKNGELPSGKLHRGDQEKL